MVKIQNPGSSGGGAGVVLWTSGAPHGGAGATAYWNTSNGDGTENRRQTPVPKALTAKNLFIFAQNTPGVGESWTFTLRKNGAPTALTVTINHPDTTGDNVVDEVSFAAGDLVAMEVVGSAGATARFFGSGFEVA